MCRISSFYKLIRHPVYFFTLSLLFSVSIPYFLLLLQALQHFLSEFFMVGFAAFCIGKVVPKRQQNLLSDFPLKSRLLICCSCIQIPEFSESTITQTVRILLPFVEFFAEMGRSENYQAAPTVYLE